MKVCLRRNFYTRCKALVQWSLSDDYDYSGDLFLFYYFFRSKMSSSSVVSKDVGDFVSSYASKEKIHLLRSGMDVSSSEDEDRIILEIRSPLDRVTTHVSFKPHFIPLVLPPFIKDMGFIFPLSLFPLRY